MPAKIRLTRQGRKKRPVYHIVVADSRAPRDGKFIEILGQYNPNTNPASIDLDFDKSLDWLQKGAQPTDTCRAILSYKGVLMKKHLLEGAKKGAFSEDEAQVRFDKWLNEKEAKIKATTESLAKVSETEAKKRLEAEAKVKEAKAAALAKKRAAESEAARAGETEVAEAVIEEKAVETEDQAPAEIAAEEEAPAEVEEEVQSLEAEVPADQTPVAEDEPANEEPSEEEKKEE